MLRQFRSALAVYLAGGGSPADRERRRQFLRTFVMCAGAFLGLLTLANLAELLRAPSAMLVQYVALDLLGLAGLAAFWAWLRHHYSITAGYGVVLALILGITAFFPPQVLDRMLIAYAVPTLAASFILTPISSFFAAFLSIMGYTLNYYVGRAPADYNYLFVLVLGLLAYLAWAIARRLDLSLRQAELSQAQYQALVERLPAFVYLTEFGREGRWLYASPQVATLLGYTPAEWLADLEIWHRQLHPEDAERVAAAVDHSRTTGTPLHVEYRWTHRDGRQLWLRDDATVINLPGQSPRLQGVIIDVTERKQAEEALRKSEARIRALLNAIPDLMFRLSGDGVFRDYWTSRDDLHLTPEAFLDRAVDEVFPKPLAEQTRRSIAKALATNELQTFEYQLQVDGDDRDYEARLVASGEDEVLAIVRNITARKQAEAALRASEVRYRAIVEDQTELICRFRPDGSLSFANEAYYRYFGQAPGERLEQHIAQLVHEEDRPMVQQQFRRLSRENPVVSYEHRALAANGEIRWLRWTDRAIFDPGGHVIEYQSVGQDVTERRRGEEQIRASLREKEVLLREIHHRVKNNLQVMASLLSLQTDHVQDQQALAILQESQGRIRSMALVHEELYQSSDLAQVDFGAYLNKLVSSLLHAYGARAGIQLRLEVGEVLLAVDTAIPCGLIINELVSNALKYAFPDGRTGALWVTFARCEDQWRLTVGDDGVGLPPTLDFRNTDSLGLQLVNVLARQLRGQLEVGSPTGTVFTITFPAH